jgi:prepilin-type N-terminal cleavage/methylation domain-containing protein/prepilin-type processing-associated H-X9-DG protein
MAITSKNRTSERGRLIRVFLALGGTRKAYPCWLRRFEQPHAAFTLVELLIVLLVLAVLGMCLLPALARSSTDPQALHCLSNLKRLMAGWQMYAADNQDSLVCNTDGELTGQQGSGYGIYGSSWVGGWLSLSYSPDNTNVNFLVNHDLNPNGTYAYCGFLGAYVNDPALWKCPVDKLLSSTGNATQNRVRSYSMNNLVGSLARTWSGGHAAAGATLAAREGSSKYPIYEKYHQIRSPATVFVMLDERPECINDGDFFSDPDTTWQLVDFPSCYHNEAAGFGFADGHAEIHKWVDARTRPVGYPSQIFTLDINLPMDADVTWLQQHATGTQ